MIKIVKLVRTCHACPSQWDAWDDRGVYYYIRYRHGNLTVDVGKVRGPMVFQSSQGGQWDGLMYLDELRLALGGTFELPDTEEGVSMEPEEPEDTEAFTVWLAKLNESR